MKYLKISNFATVVTGGTPSTSKKEYWDNGDIPWLQSGCCQNCFVNEASSFITQLGYDNSVTKMMPKDTVLIALTGATAGKVGYLTFEACGNQSITGILPNETVNSRFLFYYLLFKRPEILSDCVGGAQPHISQGYVKNILVPIYSKQEQINIVRLLDNISSSIANEKGELNRLQELIKSRFEELFSNYQSNTKPMNSICNICRGASPRPISAFITDDVDGVNWIKIGDVGEDDIYITKTSEKITHAGAEKSRRVKPGDFILSNSMSFGRPYILGINGCVHDGWLIISDYSKHLDPLYFYYEIRSDFVQDQFNGSASGSTVRNLNSDLVRKVFVRVPPLSLQKEFAKFVTTVDSLKSKIISNICSLEELLDKKMNDYFGSDL